MRDWDFKLCGDEQRWWKNMRKIKAIQEWKRPLTQNGHRSLLALANYYHHFNQGFSKVVRTLSKLLQKWLSQEWDKFCHQNFGKLKNKLFYRQCSNSHNLTNPLWCIWGRLILSFAEYWCKMVAHCIWEHEPWCLSKKMANSWEIALRLNTLQH